MNAIFPASMMQTFPDSVHQAPIRAVQDIIAHKRSDYRIVPSNHIITISILRRDSISHLLEKCPLPVSGSKTHTCLHHVNDYTAGLVPIFCFIRKKILYYSSRFNCLFPKMNARKIDIRGHVRFIVCTVVIVNVVADAGDFLRKID